MTSGKNSCRCAHHKVFPVLIVLFGLAFLLQALGVISPELVDICWPILIIVAGIAKMTSMDCKCC